MRLIDKDELLSSLKNSYLAVREREDRAILEEHKARANSEAVAFLECYLRVNEMPTVDVEEVKHENEFLKRKEDE